MNCVENLKSKSEIQIKLKQIFQQTTASGCHLNHLLIQMVPARGSKTWREQNIFTFPWFVEKKKQPSKPV